MIKVYQSLRKIEKNLLEVKLESYYRDDYFNIDWDNDVIWLFWERWVWKTTIMIQKRNSLKNAFYFSADNVSIKSNWLFEFVFFVFNNFDINYFFIDEIFKYENWKDELKNIIDSLPQVKIVFSGSSSMALYDWIIDLWRRIFDYKINTLSFREFLKLKYNINLEKVSFEELLNNHQKISLNYSLKIKEIYFKEFLEKWAYPFWLDISYESFLNRLLKTLDRIVFEDLPYIKNFQTQSLDKVSKLLYFIVNTTPSELSINHLSKKIWVDKNIVDNVLFLLSKIWSVNLIQKWTNLSDKVRKEYKIFLSDTNKYFVYDKDIDIWIIREAFFVSEIKKIKNIDISLPSKEDFLISFKNENFIFEIGGKNKKNKSYQKNTFIVKDDIFVSQDKNILPLYLFWFLN